MSTRVLVVEDDADIRESISDVLRFAGYIVEGAADGAEALRALHRDPSACVVLLDLMMPGMNGWEMLAVMSHDQFLASVPVVVTSAVASGVPKAATRVLPKPIDLRKLLDTVNEFCGPCQDQRSCSPG